MMQKINPKAILWVFVGYMAIVLILCILSGCSRKVHTYQSEYSQQTSSYTRKMDSVGTFALNKEIKTTFFGDTLRGSIYLAPNTFWGGSDTVESPVRLPVEDSLESNGIKIKLHVQPNGTGGYRVGVTAIAKPTGNTTQKESQATSAAVAQQEDKGESSESGKEKAKDVKTTSYWQVVVFAIIIVAILIVLEVRYQKNKLK